MRFVRCRLPLIALALLVSARCSAPPSENSTIVGAAATESAAGESCAAKLSPDASSIYHAAAPEMHRDTDLRSLLRAKVMPMVATDQIQISAARPAAEQAAACLQLVRR